MKKFAFILVCSLLAAGCAEVPVQSGINIKKASIYRHMASNIVLYKDYRDVPKSISYLYRANKLEPENAETFYLLGISYMIENKMNIAYKWLTKSIKINQNNADARNALGIWYGKKQKWDLALEQFDYVISHSNYKYPVNSFYNRALTYEHLYKYNEAIKDLRSAIALSKGFNRSWLYHLASNYYEIGKFGKTTEVLNNIKHKYPLNHEESFLMAKSFLRLKEYKKSISILNRLVKDGNSEMRKKALVYIRIINAGR